MSNRDIMLSALKESTFQLLFEQGFAGKYPNFRRKLDNCIELISFQTNKYGGSFTIEVSAIFPNGKNKNYELYEGVTEETFGVEAQITATGCQVCLTDGFIIGISIVSVLYYLVICIAIFQKIGQSILYHLTDIN